MRPIPVHLFWPGWGFLFFGLASRIETEVNPKREVNCPRLTIPSSVRSSSNTSSPQIIKELRGRGDAGDEEMVPCPGAGHVEEVALGVIDFL